MRSQAQLEASRRNGAMSKGPTTPEGKAIASRNHTIHGLCADNKAVVIEGEDPEAWDELLQETIRDFNPINGTELDLVTEIAVARWRIRRCWTMETAAADKEIALQRSTLEQQFQNPDMPMRHVSAYTAAADGMRLIDRYETRLTRIFNRAVKNLADFRARGIFTNNTSNNPDTADNHQQQRPTPTPRISNLRVVDDRSEPQQPKQAILRIEPKNPCKINMGINPEPENLAA